MGNSIINGAFEKIVDRAMNEVACKGWDNVDHKTVTLASMGMMYKTLRHERLAFSRPIYWLAGILGGGIVWQIVEFVLTR